MRGKRKEDEISSWRTSTTTRRRKNKNWKKKLGRFIIIIKIINNIIMSIEGMTWDKHTHLFLSNAI